MLGQTPLTFLLPILFYKHRHQFGVLLAGKVLARPLFAEDLPALKNAHAHSHSLEDQPPAQSFKGFPTGKGDEPAPAAVMDTADIWKPRLSDTGISFE